VSKHVPFRVVAAVQCMPVRSAQTTFHTVGVNDFPTVLVLLLLFIKLIHCMQMINSDNNFWHLIPNSIRLKAKETKKCHHRLLMSADAVEFGL
jgi:hypothetical protein